MILIEERVENNLHLRVAVLRVTTVDRPEGRLDAGTTHVHPHAASRPEGTIACRVRLHKPGGSTDGRSRLGPGPTQQLG